MKDKELNILLRDQADELGVCEKFREVWSDDFSRQDLVAFYKRGIEFCIDNSFPSDDFIKKHFDKELLERNNIFMDGFGVVSNGNGVYVCNDNSKGTLRFSGMDVATVYVMGNSSVSIEAYDLSKVFIDLLDGAELSAVQKGSSAVYVYKKSKESVLNTSGNVRTRIKG